MKKMLIAVASAAAALVSVSGTANAAPWQSINQREARIEMQIRQGIRSGALTRAEAMTLQNRLGRVERLERNFRRNGLTMTERRLLDNRYDSIARSLRVQLADGEVRGGRSFHRF
jgi:hypothetical protein